MTSFHNIPIDAISKLTGTIAHMQLWVDGVMKSSVASTSLNTSVSMAAGTHRCALIATKISGQKWGSAVNAAVKQTRKKGNSHPPITSIIARSTTS